MRVTVTPSPKPVRAIAIVLAAFLALSAWALSSPSGSSPDDDFHLASIWCAQGERAGLCESITDKSVDVPAHIPLGSCFAFHNDTTGACQEIIGDELISTDRSNLTSHSYPGGFYWAMSWFASPNVTASALAMRLINVALFLALAVATFVMSARRLRQPMLVAIGITIVPLGMFIVASTNPSSWALYSPLFVYVLARSLLDESSRRRSWMIAVLVVAAGAIAAAARADAALFVLVAFGLALWGPLTRWVRRAQVWAAGISMMLISGVSVLSGRQSGSALAGLSDSTNGAGVGLLLKNLLEIPSLYIGALGGWGLGWLDTSPPAIVFASLTLLLGGLVFGAISVKQSRREFIVPGLVLILMIALPLVMSQGAAASIGTFVQPRYVLPLLALGVVTLITTNTTQYLISPRQVFLGLLIVTAANALSLYINVARYSTGLSNMALNLNAGSWQPIGTAFGVLLLGVAAFTAVSLLSYRWMVGSDNVEFVASRTRLR